MASLRDCARSVREEAADGICWIALWREGRSWNAETIWPEDMLYDKGIMVLESYYLERLLEIVKAESSAILVSGEYSNIGCAGDGSLPDVQVLTNALRWQYEDCHPLITDWDLKEAV